MSAVLEIRGLDKTYGSTVALRGADMEIEEGSIHAVIGENGAGKSTLVKILAGLVRPDAGEVRFGGEPLSLSHPADALKHGISVAFQELSFVPDLSVATNLLLPHLPRSKWRTISRGQLQEHAQDLLGEWEVETIDPKLPGQNLSLPNRQKIEIVRALSRTPRLLILDEPTSALGQRDVEWLFRQIRSVRQRGTTVIFVSHRISEVRAISESLTVFRNGRRAGVASTAEVGDAEIIRLMIGESLSEIYPAGTGKRNVDENGTALSVRDAKSGRVQRSSFDLRWGEILGVAGLEGQGQRDLFMTLFGAQRLEYGQLRVDGNPIKIRSPRQAIRAGMGISLVPEDRAREGAFLSMTGRANLTMPSLKRFTRLSWIQRSREKSAVRMVLQQLRIDQRALGEPVETFSGGNQQKIVIGKWLLAESKILLMYDPTRGVDVRTKSEIFHLMRDFTNKGGAILFYSTDVDELANVCDRVLVFYRGAVADEVDLGDRKVDAVERIFNTMLGGRRTDSEAIS